MNKKDKPIIILSIIGVIFLALGLTGFIGFMLDKSKQDSQSFAGSPVAMEPRFSHIQPDIHMDSGFTEDSVAIDAQLNILIDTLFDEPLQETNEIIASENTTNETVSQRNAVRKAKDYLDFMSFSRDGLIAQLEFDQFSYSDAEYGADNSGADWYMQARLKAQDYLDIMAFSRDGLIDQLIFDGFTRDQAIYGVDNTGL
jgi:hypothetical protein